MSDPAPADAVWRSYGCAGLIRVPWISYVVCVQGSQVGEIDHILMHSSAPVLTAAREGIFQVPEKAGAWRKDSDLVG